MIRKSREWLSRDGEDTTKPLRMKISSWAELVLPFLSPPGISTCSCVCRDFMNAAHVEIPLWKDLYLRRWRDRDVDSVGGGYRRLYASLNCWRRPSLSRTIITTEPHSHGRRRTNRDSVRAHGDPVGLVESHIQTEDITAVDLGPSKLVICAKEWVRYLPLPLPRTSTMVLTDYEENRESRRNFSAGISSGPSSWSSGDATGAENHVPVEWGRYHCCGSSISEVHLSKNERHCFFGGSDGRLLVQELRESGPQGVPCPICNLTDDRGHRTGVQQVVSDPGHASPTGFLAILCKKAGVTSPGEVPRSHLYVVDTTTQAAINRVDLPWQRPDLDLYHTPLGGRGRAGFVVGMAAIGGHSSAWNSDGNVFAVGYEGGAVSLVDIRIPAGGARGSVVPGVGGIITKHRWLQRVRGAGNFLMASFGRSKRIETWDVRCFRARDQLPPLCCSGNAPDFWSEPHGLTVAAHGGGRNTQTGTLHTLWEWPDWCASSISSLKPTLAEDFSWEERGSGEVEVKSGKAIAAASATAFAEGSGTGGRAGAGVDSSLGQQRVKRMRESRAPGVVLNSDYRTALSCGIKFTSNHLMTVLDKRLLLVDEVLAAPGMLGVGGGRIGWGHVPEESVRYMHIA
ncbi:unnamed protein product [Discosporangium mesarthrocarpum]